MATGMIFAETQQNIKKIKLILISLGLHFSTEFLLSTKTEWLKV
jgi:hypothetical protein